MKHTKEITIAATILIVGIIIGLAASWKVTVNDEVKNKQASLSDAAFLAAAGSDAGDKVIARGDINGDGFEDAIVEQMTCGASCSFNLAVVFNHNNTSAVSLKTADPYKANFEPAFVGSSAVKSQLINITIKDGIISLSGQGLACTPPGSEEPCTEEKWKVMKMINYKFNGKDIVQLDDNATI